MEISELFYRMNQISSSQDGMISFLGARPLFFHISRENVLKLLTFLAICAIMEG